ncbi:hypothetical protein BROC_00993 [Candidatus Brocadiaceae bacterium]|nr:hypothetical protein BROC_00993 [Candidatus Brocadiaceae bacterium]
MRYLFFFVHPYKFHVFRNTIYGLIYKGHSVDILITSKDVLENLVKAEGWSYTNIFPEGRKIEGLSPLLSSGVNFLRTLYRLFKFVRKRKHDLYITDDLLVYFSKFKKTPSIVFTDDDLSITKQFALVLAPATYILAPEITDLAKYNKKKIAFDGYKELAYLHPDEFTPDRSVVDKLIAPPKDFFVIRLVSLRAYHDVGMKGLSNNEVSKLISILQKHGRVFISSERKLPEELEHFRLNIEPAQILHFLAFAKLFIGDSQTMSSEASVLGTFSLRCNDFCGKINVMDEKERYGLMKSYLPSEFKQLLLDVEEILQSGDHKDIIRKRKEKMLSEKINLTKFMIKLFEELPLKHPNSDKVRSEGSC